MGSYFLLMRVPEEAVEATNTAQVTEATKVGAKVGMSVFILTQHPEKGSVINTAVGTRF